MPYVFVGQLIKKGKTDMNMVLYKVFILMLIIKNDMTWYES